LPVMRVASLLPPPGVGGLALPFPLLPAIGQHAATAISLLL
jgi:hypothetical protein